MTGSEPVKSSQAPRRRLMRNYLLDWRFQFKYTGMVVVVTTIVALVLGWRAYDYSTEMSEALRVQVASTPDLTPDMVAYLNDEAAAEDARLLRGIALGVVLLILCLGLTGVIITHRVVGPAYRMKLLFRHVKKGNLEVLGALRKDDELQDVFEAFAELVEDLRARQRAEIVQLDAAIDVLRKHEVPPEALEPFTSLRSRMDAELGERRPE